MLDLFKKYVSEGKITEALLVGRNLFNRNPSDNEAFFEYFEYLCTLAETLPNFNDRQNFAEQANIALAFYSENATLTNILVDKLLQLQQRVSDIFCNIDCTKAEKIKSEQIKIESQNSEHLKNLYTYKDLMHRSNTQNEFDDILIKIGNVDSKINKELFTDEQNATYEALTKEITELISSKMRQLEHKRNVDYNKQAADAFASAFNQFRNNENKYKNQMLLFSLASKTLFAFDASRLFNETLIYYNHVYSYIFSKLDDDGKLALTRYSIECERNMR